MIGYNREEVVGHTSKELKMFQIIANAKNLFAYCKSKVASGIEKISKQNLAV